MSNLYNKNDEAIDWNLEEIFLKRFKSYLLE